jgi:hypothetical protein
VFPRASTRPRGSSATVTVRRQPSRFLVRSSSAAVSSAPSTSAASCSTGSAPLQPRPGGDAHLHAPADPAPCWSRAPAAAPLQPRPIGVAPLQQLDPAPSRWILRPGHRYYAPAIVQTRFSSSSVKVQPSAPVCIKLRSSPLLLSASSYSSGPLVSFDWNNIQC